MGSQGAKGESILSTCCDYTVYVITYGKSGIQGHSQHPQGLNTLGSRNNRVNHESTRSHSSVERFIDDGNYGLQSNAVVTTAALTAALSAGHHPELAAQLKVQAS